MKNLYNVTCEILINADDQDDAKQRVYAFLEGETSPDINFMVHYAERDENFQTLKDLRKHQGESWNSHISLT